MENKDVINFIFDYPQVSIITSGLLGLFLAQRKVRRFFYDDDVNMTKYTTADGKKRSKTTEERERIMGIRQGPSTRRFRLGLFSNKRDDDRELAMSMWRKDLTMIGLGVIVIGAIGAIGISTNLWLNDGKPNTQPARPKRTEQVQKSGPGWGDNIKAAAGSALNGITEAIWGGEDTTRVIQGRVLNDEEKAEMEAWSDAYHAQRATEQAPVTPTIGPPPVLNSTPFPPAFCVELLSDQATWRQGYSVFRPAAITNIRIDGACSELPSERPLELVYVQCQDSRGDCQVIDNMQNRTVIGPIVGKKGGPVFESSQAKSYWQNQNH